MSDCGINKSNKYSTIILCQSELFCDVLCWQDKGSSVTRSNFLPKPNIREMFWYGWRKSFSCLLIIFFRILHSHNIQVHSVESDPVFYARTTHKVNTALENRFYRPKQCQKGPSAGRTVYIRRYQALGSPQPCNCQEAGTIQLYAVALTPRYLQQGHLISNKVISLLFYHHQLWKKLQVRILLVSYYCT